MNDEDLTRQIRDLSALVKEDIGALALPTDFFEVRVGKLTF